MFEQAFALAPTLLSEPLRVGRAAPTHLAAGVPQRNRVVVGGVGPDACGIDAAQLLSIVANVFVGCGRHQPKHWKWDLATEAANAKGLVSDPTPWPASRPSPP